MPRASQQTLRFITTGSLVDVQRSNKRLNYVNGVGQADRPDQHPILVNLTGLSADGLAHLAASKRDAERDGRPTRKAPPALGACRKRAARPVPSDLPKRPPTPWRPWTPT